MANFNRSEEARRNRMSAMVDDGEVPAPAPVSTPAADMFDGRKQLREACAIRLDRIIADPGQPRTEFDPNALARLAESLKARGQLQPIRVRWDEGRGVYVVVVGERRWRAAGMAGLQSLMCVVVTGNPSSVELLEDQLVENALREDLKPGEQAKAFRALMSELGLTQQQLADKLQISQTTVSHALDLLDLPKPVLARVDAGALAASAARHLVKIEDPTEQAELAARMESERLSRKETAAAVRNATGRKGKGKARKVTSRVIRTETGPRVTIESKKELDLTTTLKALTDAANQIRDEINKGLAAA